MGCAEFRCSHPCTTAARALLPKPKDERDRLMKRASTLVAQDYQDGGALSGLELLSEEDHLDRSIDD